MDLLCVNAPKEVSPLKGPLGVAAGAADAYGGVDK